VRHENSSFTTFSQTTKRASSILGPIILGSLLVIVTLLVLLALPAADIDAQSVMTAHIVIQLGDGTLWVRPITFTGEISGAHTLAETDLEFEQMGEAVCKIEGIGCPASDCFCPENLWTQSLWDGSGWAQPWPFPNLQDGDVWAFAYDAGWPPDVAPVFPLVAASNGLEWLRPLQSTDDGGYGAGGPTAETLSAVGANGYRAAEWRRANSPSLSAYFLANGTAYADTGASSSGKMAVALAAGDGCWPWRSVDPMSYYHPGTGAYSSTQPFDAGTGAHMWGMLGTATLSETVPPLAAEYLKSLQQGDGAWEWDVGFGTDTNSTALAIQALIAAGEPAASSAIVNALAYLDTAQNDDGGFPYSPVSPFGTDSDTNSTAYAVQALLAAGESPSDARWAKLTDGITPTNPISYLLGMQVADGSFEYQKGVPGDRQSSTRQAIPSLLGRSLPLSVTELDQCGVMYFPLIYKGYP
jgi:hypothetical protein